MPTATCNANCESSMMEIQPLPVILEVWVQRVSNKQMAPLLAMVNVVAESTAVAWLPDAL